MSLKKFMHYARYGMVLMSTMLWPFGSQATLDIPDLPLFLNTVGVPPNIVMTFDDSGSMRRGWAPESVASDQVVIDGPRFKSPSVNGLYYNPKLTYNIPTRSDSVSYSTSFTDAKFNGFDSGSGSVNLSTSYKVVGQSEPDHDYDDCPCYNSMSCSTYLTTTNSASTCRLVKHPGSTTSTTNTATCTNVFFNDREFRKGSARNDEIKIQGAEAGCSTFFQGIPVGTAVTVTGAGGRNGTYTVTSRENDQLIRIQPAFSSNFRADSATLSWASTTTSGGNTAPVPAYYYLYFADKPGEPQPASCTPSRANDNCYVRVIVSDTSGADRDGDGTISASEADERQNFANWYSFYRTRAMAVMSGAMTAITGVENEKIRLGWQTINECTSFGTTCQGYDNVSRENRLRTLSDSYKTNFYHWLQRFEVSGNTPLRSAVNRAGNYFSLSTGGKDNPYAFDPYVAEFDTTLPLAERRIYACRKNFHVLFTDGLWNSDSSYDMPGPNNPDSTSSTTLGDNTTVYNPTEDYAAPYRDTNTTNAYSNSNGIADTAFYYWARDLRTNLDNTVPADVSDLKGTSTERFWSPKNDPATWQHMVNYTIGLGLSASLVPECYYRTGTGVNLVKDPNNPDPGCPAWGGDTYAGDYADLRAGTLNWPQINTSPTINEEPDGHVYELWHAAINSRGKFYSADNPAELVRAFQDVMDTISAAAAAGGGAGLSSNTTKTTQVGATAFEAKFNADWSGTLEAFPILANGTFGTPYWEAGQLIPPAVSRHIFTLNDGTAEEVTSSVCGDSNPLATALNQDANRTADNLCSQRLAWLRGYTRITGASWASGTVTFTAADHGLVVGDSVVVTGVTPATYNRTYVVASVTTNSFTASLGGNPGSYGSDPTNDDRVRYADFRDRTFSVLGDIMNSDPIYALNEDFGYGGSNVVDGHDTYTAYVAGKTDRTPVVYVGANDGMLHAFNAEISGPNMGKELFAYVPAAVYGNLSALTAPGYSQSHKYYVDGPPTLGDAYINGWKTYLVGGLGAGGKSIYALDVSNTDVTGADFDPQDLVKWEFNDNSDPSTPGPGDDMGLTFSQPQIAPISADQWAAIFGNGYNSTSDKAFLYIVDLSNGGLIIKIPTNSTTSNGLSTPYLYDSDGNKIVDVIYAGDLQGNLWKFEKSGVSWILGNGGNPLFTARNAAGEVQSITSQPKAAPHPKGGVMVYFGTGRYLETDDLTNDDVQTFYGIWDKPSTTGTVPRTDLLQQTILSTLNVTLDGFSTQARTVSANTPNATTPERGCFLDFPATTNTPSERIISTPLIQTFRRLETRIIFVTAIPNSVPCEKGGVSWLMEVNLNCGRLGTSPFDINGDDKFDEGDVIQTVATPSGSDERTVTGIQLDSILGISKTPLWMEGESGKAFKGFTGTSGERQTIEQSRDTDDIGNPVRIYWEQIQ